MFDCVHGTSTMSTTLLHLKSDRYKLQYQSAKAILSFPFDNLYVHLDRNGLALVIFLFYKEDKRLYRGQSNIFPVPLYFGNKHFIYLFGTNEWLHLS